MLTEELMAQRSGNFTASENHRLMAGWDKELAFCDFERSEEVCNIIRQFDKKPTVGFVNEMTGLKITGVNLNLAWSVVQREKPPQGLITYAKEKAIEELFFHDPSLDFSTAHTRNGEERELKCVQILSEKTGLNFTNIGEQQSHIFSDGIGCTPDGIVLDDTDLVLTGVEAKCKSAKEHAKNLLINNNEDMKHESFDHYVQIQTAMLVTDCNHWYFANYNPFAKHEKLFFKHIVIYRDQHFIDILKSRIEIAKCLKDEYLNKIKQAV